MRCFTAVVLASLASLSLNGCQLVSRFTGGQQAEEEVTEVVPVPAEDEAAAESEEFDEPLVSAAPDPAAIARADLIQSTNSNERVQQINRSRSNPYQEVPIPPPPTAAPPAPAGSPQPTATAPTGTLPPMATAPGGSPGTNGSPGGSAQPGVAQPGGSSAPGGAQPGGGQSAGGDIAALPQLPSTSLASAVQVSGVVRIGNTSYAIVNAPEEPTSRYVRVGQRVANNRVLIKRIEFGGGEPRVILEQNGIEVARPVGGTEDPMESDAPTASLEVPLQVIANVAARP